MWNSIRRGHPGLGRGRGPVLTALLAIRWDWLQPLITVPYVPALGPVHPDALTSGLVQFLQYDKDSRWGGFKDESVLTGAVVQEPGLVMVPTLSTRRVPRVKVCVYSHDPRDALSRAADLGRQLCTLYDANKGRLAWFAPPGSDPDPVAACGRIQLQTFGSGQPSPVSGALPLDELTGAVRMSFSAFAEKLAAEGFAFLDSRIRQHGGIGPVLTCERDGQVVGAIGPMEIMPDSQGAARLLPQYFGVLPEYRGLGLGRLLWQAAMHWGQEHGAAYQLLQTEVDGASDRLCRSEGLTDLGLVYTTPI